MGNPKASELGQSRITPPKANKKKKNKQVTSSSDWKKKGSNPKVELEVPSGAVCLARPVGMEAFVKAGIIPNSLMAIVEESMRLSKAGEEPDVEEMMEEVTDEQMVDILRLFDAVVCNVVIEPKVHPVPQHESERDDETLYADEVDINDKMFIFNFAVGGTRDLEQFRQSQEEFVDALQSEQGDGGSAE